MSSPMFAWLMPKMDSNPRGLNFIVKILSDEKLLRSSVVLLRTRMSSFFANAFCVFSVEKIVRCAEVYPDGRRKTWKETYNKPFSRNKSRRSLQGRLGEKFYIIHQLTTRCSELVKLTDIIKNFGNF